MADKKIQPKRPTANDEPAAGARKAEKTSAKLQLQRKVAKVTARKVR
jgi:hypothetical protein